MFLFYYYDNNIMYFCISILKYNLEVLYHDDIYLHSLVIGQSHAGHCCSCLQWAAEPRVAQIVITRPVAQYLQMLR